MFHTRGEMISRRAFSKMIFHGGLAAMSTPLWLDEMSARAFAQLASSYKAVVVVTLKGGNDGNNIVVPLDGAQYAQYASLRSSLTLNASDCLPLTSAAGAPAFGMHPSLTNIAAMYNSSRAAIVANVGPLSTPMTKAQILANPSIAPQELLSHPAGVNQWESASTLALPTTGWGGRMADVISSQSGSLPPMFNAGSASIFTAGRSVQGIAVSSQAGSTTVLPAGMQDAIMAIAAGDAQSPNAIVSQAAQLRIRAVNQQALIVQAQSSGTPLSTVFPTSSFGQSMQAIAGIIKGRSVIGASRQIFYTQQGNYDTHGGQLALHAGELSDLDSSLGAFMSALDEMGLSNQVLVCTHSDFNRTLTANVAGGSDHAWGNHQLVLGGGIRGGQMIGTYPDLDLGGSMDLNGYGTWVPTLSVTQMAAGIGTWMGLNSSQLASVFPDLGNFPGGAISLT
jgi:uncharacterized protein (DUF1501 family)